MDRRKLITRIAAAGIGAGLAGCAAAAKEAAEVRYRITGFTCVTSAVCLEVTLRQHPGVTRASASYPERSVVIGFDRNLTTEKALQDLIRGCGFKVA